MHELLRLASVKWCVCFTVCVCVCVRAFHSMCVHVDEYVPCMCVCMDVYLCVYVCVRMLVWMSVCSLMCAGGAQPKAKSTAAAAATETGSPPRLLNTIFSPLYPSFTPNEREL